MRPWGRIRNPEFVVLNHRGTPEHTAARNAEGGGSSAMGGGAELRALISRAQTDARALAADEHDLRAKLAALSTPRGFRAFLVAEDVAQRAARDAAARDAVAAMEDERARRCAEEEQRIERAGGRGGSQTSFGATISPQFRGELFDAEAISGSLFGGGAHVVAMDDAARAERAKHTYDISRRCAAEQDKRVLDWKARGRPNAPPSSGAPAAPSAAEAEAEILTLVGKAEPAPIASEAVVRAAARPADAELATSAARLAPGLGASGGRARKAPALLAKARRRRGRNSLVWFLSHAVERVTLRYWPSVLSTRCKMMRAVCRRARAPRGDSRGSTRSCRVRPTAGWGRRWPSSPVVRASVVRAAPSSLNCSHTRPATLRPTTLRSCCMAVWLVCGFTAAVVAVVNGSERIDPGDALPLPQVGELLDALTAEKGADPDTRPDMVDWSQFVQLCEALGAPPLSKAAAVASSGGGGGGFFGGGGGDEAPPDAVELAVLNATLEPPPERDSPFDNPKVETCRHVKDKENKTRQRAEPHEGGKRAMAVCIARRRDRATTENPPDVLLLRHPSPLPSFPPHRLRRLRCARSSTSTTRTARVLSMRASCCVY